MVIFLPKKNPIGINFQDDVLQHIATKIKQGESRSLCVNRLLREHRDSCNTSSDTSDLVEKLLVLFKHSGRYIPDSAKQLFMDSLTQKEKDTIRRVLSQ